MGSVSYQKDPAVTIAINHAYVCSPKRVPSEIGEMDTRYPHPFIEEALECLNCGR
ncbi:hypothetical protein KSX_68080 [Ktedonospora formicarum]|uniref:Uncharacterized protein n=1 Tax=Ktedonospora formicarum TaxID=2778364 RepID=A0A8J3I888_9CHLR|nr:hypothetical protein KSX_68080 [Ktedonospora formicarum]